jgi:uncharacterized protein with von Willebrand factor type A (vWA) domain
MSEKAIRSVIVRARESLGPVQKPYRYHQVEQAEANELISQGAVLEFDIEESLQNYPGKNSPVPAELVYQARVERNYGMVLLLDTSLSMKGEKLALLGVTIAAVAASVPSQALCILGFDSEIHAIKEFNENVAVEILVSRILSIPPGGFTNIELGLKSARERIRAGIFPRARVILVSDGRYTEGRDPVEEAKNFHFIYPVTLGKDPGGRSIMREIAATGLGRASEVREMKELPRFLLNAIRTWVK